MLMNRSPLDLERQCLGLLCLGLLHLVGVAKSVAAQETPQSLRTRASAARGLLILQRAARAYPEHESCFSCHHQALPLLAMTTARSAGLAADNATQNEIVDFTRRSFEERRERLAKGQSIGGRSATVGYGLWTFALQNEPASPITSAMTEFLLAQQTAEGAWSPPSHRPPLESSKVSCTVLARHVLRRYAESDARDRVAAAWSRSTEWLKTAPLTEQEDLNFALWDAARGCEEGRDESPAVDRLRTRILTARHADGGWSQVADRTSDAYATGQTLYILLDSTQIPRDDAVVREAVAYLLETQHPDGSWHVRTRSRPIQPWFDNGDPHGADQFISIAATSWATAALAKTLIAPPPAREQ